MKRYAIVLGFVLFPLAAVAEPYPATLSVYEQERHDFYDVQREAYPGGRIEGTSRIAPSMGDGGASEATTRKRNAAAPAPTRQ